MTIHGSGMRVSYGFSSVREWQYVPLCLYCSSVISATAQGYTILDFRPTYKDIICNV